MQFLVTIKKLQFIFIVIILIVFYAPKATATVIKVPTDETSIQAGINSAVNGDTLLIEPGEYFENIKFNGKRILLVSQFIFSGDTADISQTIINGRKASVTVSFINSEDSTSVLYGLTITGGLGSYGGGIYCLNSSPLLKYLKIINNQSDIFGGGIYCIKSNSILQNIVLVNNYDKNKLELFDCS